MKIHNTFTSVFHSQYFSQRYEIFKMELMFNNTNIIHCSSQRQGCILYFFTIYRAESYSPFSCNEYRLYTPQPVIQRPNSYYHVHQK